MSQNPDHRASRAFASRYFGKKGADQTASAEPQPAPRIPQADPANAAPAISSMGLAVS